MFRFLLRALGYWSLALAVVLAVMDGAKSIASSAILFTPLGKTWFDLSPGTLNLSQAVVQRGVAPWLWDPVIQSILTLPTFAVLAALSLVLVRLGTRRRRAWEVATA